MSDSDSALQLPVPAVTVENTDTENQGDQSDVNASNASINTPSDGRKFHTIHSSDGAKFFNLENQLRELQGSNRTDSNPGSERQLTVETAIYRDQPMFTDSRRPLLPTEMRSIRSGTESTRSAKRKKRPGINTAVTPAQIFAQNLSDAVLDAEDSDEHESFVYRDKTISSTKSINPNLTWSSFEAPSYDPFQPPSSLKNSNYVIARASEGDLFREQKLRDDHESHRPALRSSVSDLPYHFGRQRNFGQSEWYPSDEESAPLIRNSYSRKRKQVSENNSRKMLISIGSLCLMTVLFAMLLLVVASPLSDIQVSSIGNVLSTQKELIFDLHVRASNRNWWVIKMVHADISIFASSHFVPLDLQVDQSNATQFINDGFLEQAADPAEFLGTIYEFDEPLVFQPAGLFEPRSTTSVSQIQIKQPGSSEDDNSGNERWSRLIRYPYQLTVRGVLKYRIFPYFTVTRVHTSRVCNVSSVDPSTGKVTDAPPNDKAICNISKPKDSNNITNDTDV
ncbi:unnamed protein product [Umbelopsis vinacea]